MPSGAVLQAIYVKFTSLYTWLNLALPMIDTMFARTHASTTPHVTTPTLHPSCDVTSYKEKGSVAQLPSRRQAACQRSLSLALACRLLVGSVASLPRTRGPTLRASRSAKGRSGHAALPLVGPRAGLPSASGLRLPRSAPRRQPSGCRRGRLGVARLSPVALSLFIFWCWFWRWWRPRLLLTAKDASGFRRQKKDADATRH